MTSINWSGAAPEIVFYTHPLWTCSWPYIDMTDMSSQCFYHNYTTLSPGDSHIGTDPNSLGWNGV